MNEIIFKRTSNVFLNVGIISLCEYIKDYIENIDGNNLSYELFPDALIVKSNSLFEVLEELYYMMGQEVYDTSMKKQKESPGNAYYIEQEDRFEKFPAKYTMGLASLLTNNAQGVTKEENNSSKIAKLRKTDPQLAQKFENYFQQNNLKLQSKIYFNEPYTKITRLEKPNLAYFEPGANKCYLSGEAYKKLVDITNTSPFFSGLTNFNSHLTTSDKKISWKVMYLSRFAPKYCFYMYNSLDTIVCYLLESNSLESLQKLYNQSQGVFKDEIVAAEDNYMSNFNFYNFQNQSKNTENRLAPGKDYTEQSETLFMLLYTIYREFLYSQGVQEPMEKELMFLDGLFLDSLHVSSLVTFKADKFSSTLRPNTFEHFNNFKFIIKLFNYLTTQKINFGQVMSSLKFLKRSDRNAKNAYRLERQIRNKVLDKILKQKSILKDIETLFYLCYTYLNSGDSIGFKNFKMLLTLVNLYEPFINTNKIMNKEESQKLQEKAIKLGSSIGIKIRDYEGKDYKANAKQARAYIIGLHKSRTSEQFREALIRLQTKYNLVISNELLYGMNEENFEFIKQFSVIGALNILNNILQTKSNNQNENK